MKVLLLSAYAAQSHVHWHDSLQQMLGQWQWQILSLPPRHFSWRIRGNALYWSLAERQLLEQPYDLLIATSMVDLATLRGLVPALGAVPSVLYFHENQFAYPAGRGQHGLLEAQMVSLYSALAADRLLFNSRYNLQSFTTGCKRLLQKLPDYVPTGVAALLAAKAAVLPVPLGDIEAVEDWWPGASEGLCHDSSGPVRIVWVGRFEYDKGATALLQIMRLLEAEGLDYEMALTGQQFRHAPPEFAEIRAHFGHRLVQFGFVESRAQYQGLLQAADLVLSTAQHEFQGLAVLEAVAAGCLPVVPDRLVYPELYPECFRYHSHPDDSSREAAAAVALILALAGGISAPPPNVARFCRGRLVADYKRELLAVAGLPGGSG